MAKESDQGKSGEIKTGGGSAHYVLIICSLLYMVNYMDRQVFSVILQPMKVELGLSDAECGLLQTILIVGMVLFSFPISYMIDRWSRSKSIGIMAILWSGFTFATGLAKNFIGLAVPRSLVGIGEAGFVPGGVAMVSASYSKKSRGLALGIFNIALPLGAAVGMMVGGLISSKFGWRTPFYYFAIPGVILGILAFFMKDYKTAAEPGKSGSVKDFGKSVWSLLKLRTLPWYYLAFGLASFMTTSVIAWLPSLVIRELNTTEATAGLIVGGIGLVSIIGAPVGGFLSDFWQKKNQRGRLYLPALAEILAAVLIVAGVLFKFSPVGIVLCMLYGIGASMAAVAVSVISQDVVQANHKGLSMGMTFFTSFILGGAWGPYATGAISDALGGGANGLQTAVLISATGGILAAICFFIASRYYPGDVEKVNKEAEAVAT
jgi:MFS family permease